MIKRCKFAIFLMTLSMLCGHVLTLPPEINEEAQWLLECELSPNKGLKQGLFHLEISTMLAQVISLRMPSLTWYQYRSCLQISVRCQK